MPPTYAHLVLADGRILLGTVAIEPNRWSTIDASGAATVDLPEWLPTIADVGFDGLELWDRHLPDDPAGATAVIDGPVPVAIFNSYVSFDDDDPSDRASVADQVRATRAEGVKCNVGNDPTAAADYAARLQDWVDQLPASVTVLCECHAGLSIAEDPATAAAIFTAVDRPGRVGAIVHTHEDDAHLRARFDAYGPLITHVHVNYLDQTTLTVPRLAERADDLHAKVDLLRRLGFAGSWTIEFTRGLLTPDDEPGQLLRQAAEDLAVLRAAIGAAR